MKLPKPKYLLRIAIPLLITAFVFYFFFRNTSLRQVKEAFSSLSLGALGLYAAFSLAGVLFRTLRFRVLLDRQVPFGPLFLITLVYNFSVDLLPARSAALGFYAYFTHKRGISWEEGTSSFVVAVLYDALAVGILLWPALFFFSGNGVDPVSVGIGLGLLIAVSIAFILFAPGILDFIGRWLKGRGKVEGIVARAKSYFFQHKSGSERLALLGLSFLIKLIKYISIYILITNLVPGLRFFSSFFIFSFGVAAAEISSMLPVQGLAGLGTWEAAFAFAISRLHLSVSDPFLIALVVHLTTQVWEYAIGLLAFLYLSLSGKKSPRPEPRGHASRIQK